MYNNCYNNTLRKNARKIQKKNIQIISIQGLKFKLRTTS